MGIAHRLGNSIAITLWDETCNLNPILSIDILCGFLFQTEVGGNDIHIFLEDLMEEYFFLISDHMEEYWKQLAEPFRFIGFETRYKVQIPFDMIFVSSLC